MFVFGEKQITPAAPAYLFETLHLGGFGYKANAKQGGIPHLRVHPAASSRLFRRSGLSRRAAAWLQTPQPVVAWPQAGDSLRLVWFGVRAKREVEALFVMFTFVCGEGMLYNMFFLFPGIRKVVCHDVWFTYQVYK